MHPGRFLFSTILLLSFLPAQDPDSDPFEDLVERAEIKADAGREREAFVLVKRAVSLRGDDRRLLRFAIDLALNTGFEEDAERFSARLLELGEGAGSRDLLRRARVLRLRGRDEEALRVLAPLLDAPDGEEPPADAPAFDFEAVSLAALIHEAHGRDKKAEALHDRLVQEARRVVIREARDLVALARAYVFFRGLREAERALLDAVRADEEFLEARLALGDLYRSWDYQLPKDSVAWYRKALEIRKGSSAAHAGMGRAYELWMKDDKARTAYKRALRINPLQREALAGLAVQMIIQRNHEEARRLIDRLLAANPRDRGGLAARAALTAVTADEQAFERDLGRVLALDPTYTRAHRLAGRVLDRYWRWNDALELLRRAVKITPDDPAVHDDHARYSFFLGLEDEGTAALRKADDLARFGSPWRKNMWIVHRKLRKEFEVIETEHFIHRVKKNEIPYLRPYLPEAAERSYALLSKKYGYEPRGLETRPGKILVELFDRHDDFAVRTIGLRGLGIQGVCFGPFIAQDSPGAGIPGFSWYRTLHHEITHTMTLGLSRGRVPRWFTEGLSTYEEITENPAWDRRMDRDLFDAFKTDNLLSVVAFDAAFQTPRVLFAYFQAGVVCTMIAEEFGFDRILEMLRAYGRGLSTPEVFSTVLGVSIADFDARFKEHVARRVAPIRLIPRLTQEQLERYEARMEADEATIDEMVRLASALVDRGLILDAQEVVRRCREKAPEDPRLDDLAGRLALLGRREETARKAFEKALATGYRNHDLHMALAGILERKGEEEALERELERALATFPSRSDARDPRLMLARMAEAAGDVERAVALREEHLALAFADTATRRKLIEWYGKQGNTEAALKHLRAMILLAPQRPWVHERLGDLLLSSGNVDEAVKEFSVLADLLVKDPARRADALVKVARILLEKKKDVRAAREAVRKALDTLPDHEAALELQQEIDASRDR